MFGKKGILVLILLVFMVFLASTVSAQTYFPNPIYGGSRWKITAYRDCSTSHTEIGSQQICFYYVGKTGRCDNYIWWSCTFPGWNGRASQEGDQIVMHGDFGRYEHGRDAIQWEILSNNLGAGHWQEWIKDGEFGTTNAFANAKLERLVAYCTCSSESSTAFTVSLAQQREQGIYTIEAEDEESPMMGGSTSAVLNFTGTSTPSESPL